jgi:hypothetical protein
MRCMRLFKIPLAISPHKAIICKKKFLIYFFVLASRTPHISSMNFRGQWACICYYLSRSRTGRGGTTIEEKGDKCKVVFACIVADSTFMGGHMCVRGVDGATPFSPSPHLFTADSSSHQTKTTLHLSPSSPSMGQLSTPQGLWICRSESEQISDTCFLRVWI